ncbi:MAG: hypothetical protein PHN75_06705 [Syntrophales bacterium]|nr:hypothetical protein [Syntrophales bacterium]
MTLRKHFFIFLALFVSQAMFAGLIYASDNDVTRKTLSGVQGVYVMVEDMQPDLLKYGAAQKAGLGREDLKKTVEMRLSRAGIKVLMWEQALKTPGIPFLYVHVNTHEYNKYCYAYDVRVELQQMVSIDANPKIKASAATWSMNITGTVDVGTMNKLKDAVGILVDRFIYVYQVANRSR